MTSSHSSSTPSDKIFSYKQLLSAVATNDSKSIMMMSEEFGYQSSYLSAFDSARTQSDIGEETYCALLYKARRCRVGTFWLAKDAEFLLVEKKFLSTIIYFTMDEVRRIFSTHAGVLEKASGANTVLLRVAQEYVSSLALSTLPTSEKGQAIEESKQVENSEKLLQFLAQKGFKPDDALQLLLSSSNPTHHKTALLSIVAFANDDEELINPGLSKLTSTMIGYLQRALVVYLQSADTEFTQYMQLRDWSYLYQSVSKDPALFPKFVTIEAVDICRVVITNSFYDLNIRNRFLPLLIAILNHSDLRKEIDTALMENIAKTFATAYERRMENRYSLEGCLDAFLMISKCSILTEKMSVILLQIRGFIAETCNKTITIPSVFIPGNKEHDELAAQLGCQLIVFKCVMKSDELIKAYLTLSLVKKVTAILDSLDADLNKVVEEKEESTEYFAFQKKKAKSDVFQIRCLADQAKEILNAKSQDEAEEIKLFSSSSSSLAPLKSTKGTLLDPFAVGTTTVPSTVLSPLTPVLTPSGK